jgi:hypothetical protein
MVKQVSEQEETNVRLLTVEISEDELAVLVACLNYVLDRSDNETLERVCGACCDEVEGMRDDMTQLIGVSEPEFASV